MSKIKTFTLDNGTGEQDLIDTSMINIASQIEAMELEDDSDVIEVTIRIEKKYTRKQFSEIGEYNG